MLAARELRLMYIIKSKTNKQACFALDFPISAFTLKVNSMLREETQTATMKYLTGRIRQYQESAFRSVYATLRWIW